MTRDPADDFDAAKLKFSLTLRDGGSPEPEVVPLALGAAPVVLIHFSDMTINIDATGMSKPELADLLGLVTISLGQDG